MSRKIIIYIISITTVALISLVGLQLHWIKNAITIKEANFDRSVNEAMANFVYKIERIETNRQIEEQMKSFQQGKSLLRRLDSINRSYFSSPDSIHSSEKNKKGFYFNTNKTSFINEIMKSILDVSVFENYKIRFEKDFIDSLISYELKNKGIKTKFEFGIYNTYQNKLLLEKTGDYTKELIKGGKSFNLHPNSLLKAPEYLIIFFPNEKNFLLLQMGGMLSISVVLILVLIFLFTYTIHTIIKQKKLSEMKNDFINNMTHEFKTPVSTVSLACEALSDKDLPKTSIFYDNYIKIINEENKRLGIMAEKILQTAVIDKGELKLNKESLSVEEIIFEAVTNINIHLEKKNGIIKTNFLAKNKIVETDKTLLINVIYNLLDNANKYTHVNPEIIITTENVEGGIVVSIKDNGIGISKSNQKKIFDKLYRVPTGNIHNVKGFGLGLSYVKAIINEHGGNVSIESELGKGATFMIFLPIEKDETIK